MKLFINSANYTHLMLDCQVAKKLSYLGKISPNQGTLVLDNIQSYTLSDLENKAVVLKDDNDNIFFTGVTLKGKISVDKKTVQLPIRDKWYSIRDTACANKTWKNTSLQTIIQDVVGMTGETSYSVANPSITVSWFSVSVNDKVRDVLEKLANSIGAYCYYDAAGTLQFTAGFNSAFSTSTAATLTNSEVSSVTIDSKSDECDYSEVSFAKKEFKANKEEVFNGANSANHWLVESGGVGVSDDYYVELDKKIYELEAYSDVAFTADAELTLDSATYNSNFQSGSQPSQDNVIKIKITNSSGLTKDISEFVIEGKAIREVRGTATYSSGNRVLQLTSDVVDDATWAGKLAQYSLEQSTGVENLNINLAELDYTLDIADKITYDSTRYVIDSISMTAKSVRITGFKDRDSAFSYTSSDVRYIRASETDIAGDGLDPEAPTGLSLSTEQPAGEYVSEITATWTASTSIDVVKYIVEYKKQGVVWGDTSKSETNGLSVEIEAEPLTWYDVRVKTVDVEEKSSGWITGSVKSADINGDSSEPNAYGFDDSECEAVVLNRVRYAHLKWKAVSTTSNDIKNFHIYYSNTSLDNEYSISKGAATLGFEPSQDEIKTFEADVFEAYIEIPTTDTWNFALVVEDYDGYFKNYYNSSSQTDDGYIAIDFSAATIGSGIMYKPGDSSSIDSGSNYVLFSVDTSSMAGIEKDWILQAQAREVTEEWGDTTYDFPGDKTYQWVIGTQYEVRIYIAESDKERVFKTRLRFKNKNGDVSDWTNPVLVVIPVSYTTAPAAPTTLTISQVTAGTYKYIKLVCSEVTDAKNYEWAIRRYYANEAGTYHEAMTAETEVYIQVDSFSYLYNYGAVRAVNSAGKSSWTTQATGW